MDERNNYLHEAAEQGWSASAGTQMVSTASSGMVLGLFKRQRLKFVGCNADHAR